MMEQALVFIGLLVVGVGIVFGGMALGDRLLPPPRR